MVGMEIMHPALHQPILLQFLPFESLTPDLILSLIERVNQSKRGLVFDEHIRIHAVIIKNPRGGARKRRADFANFDDWVAQHCGRSGSLIKVTNISLKGNNR